MQHLAITIGDERFEGRLRLDRAPRTCASFKSLLPFRQQLIHVRWSGEACWVPMGGLDLGLGPEDPTSYPQPGEILLYPGGVSETELLIAYGNVRFASKAGQLAGNPVAIISDKLDRLAELGRERLWKGSTDIQIELGD